MFVLFLDDDENQVAFAIDDIAFVREHSKHHDRCIIVTKSRPQEIHVVMGIISEVVKTINSVTGDKVTVSHTMTEEQHSRLVAGFR